MDTVPPESAWRAPTLEERYPRAQTSARENFQPPYEQGYSYSYRPDNGQTHEDRYSASAAPYHPRSAAAGEAGQPSAGQPLDDQRGEIDDIRASLREFREAVRELTESRTRRRYF